MGGRERQCARGLVLPATGRPRLAEVDLPLGSGGHESGARRAIEGGAIMNGTMLAALGILAAGAVAPVAEAPQPPGGASPHAAGDGTSEEGREGQRGYGGGKRW